MDSSNHLVRQVVAEQLAHLVGGLQVLGAAVSAGACLPSAAYRSGCRVARRGLLRHCRK